MNNPLISFKAKFTNVNPWHVVPRVIGVMGAKRCGKDTFAIALIEEAAKRGHTYTRLAFADRLYQEVADAFGVSVEFLRRDDIKDVPVPELALANCRNAEFVAVCEQLLSSNEAYAKAGLTTEALSPRFCLQKWGSDYRRTFYGDDYWRKLISDFIAAHPDERFVITDVRFADEANMLVDMFEAVTVRITRAKIDQMMAELREKGDPTACHPSETALLDYVSDYIGDNVEGDMDALKRFANQFVN